MRNTPKRERTVDINVGIAICEYEEQKDGTASTVLVFPVIFALKTDPWPPRTQMT